MDYKKIGLFISERRKDLGLTQKELANILHVTDKAVSKWERGLGCPDVSILGELSSALNVGIGEILNGEYNDNLKDNNQFILDAVNYSKESTTNNIYNKISNILYIIMFILCFYMSVIGIKQMYHFFNKENYSLLSENYELIENEKKEIIEKINILNTYKSDVFSEEDLKVIRTNNRLYNNFLSIFEQIHNQEITLNYLEYRNLKHQMNYSSICVNLYMRYVYANLENVALKDAIQTINFIINTTDKSGNLFSNESGFMYSYNDYELKNIEEEIDFEQLFNHYHIQLKYTNLILDQLIEKGEFYE